MNIRAAGGLDPLQKGGVLGEKRKEEWLDCYS
jgi:hypothetical protein